MTEKLLTGTLSLNTTNKPSHLALQANDLGSNPARYGLFLTVHYCTWFIMYSRETFNINRPAAHYDINHADRAQKIKGCDAHAC